MISDGMISFGKNEDLYIRFLIRFWGRERVGFVREGVYLISRL